MEKITEIGKKLKQKLSPKVFNKLAKKTRFIQRVRKTEGFDIFWSIISGFVIGQATEIAGMLRAFIKDSGKRINYSAWYNRLAKAGFAEFMREVAMYLINHMYTQHLKPEGLLKQFDDIHIQDGSSVAINDLLKKTFPGRFKQTAPGCHWIACVLQPMLWQLPWRGLGRGHRVSEYKFMPKATEYRLKNTLSLFDRGYNSLDHLHETEQAHEFFMVRMKENMNPRILWANHKDQRRDVYFRNRPLQEIKLNSKKKSFNACAWSPYGTRWPKSMSCF